MGQTASEHMRGGEEFPATHWSVILQAAQGGSATADASLAKLCEDYWYPIYAFLRHRGHKPEEAEDLTHGFFDRLLHKDVLAGLTAEGGRFRSFLLTALKRFLVNEWHREHAQKRGGTQVTISFDDAVESRYQQELVDHATPEAIFEQQWALTVLDRVFTRLREEYASAGKSELFSHLQGCLPGAGEELSYAEAGAALQMSEAALRMSAHRLRRRYGELLRAEITQTVSNPDEVDEEIHHLIAAACGG
jgi:RNA polymerase sigma factor (sigma-70 family)